MDEIVIRTAGKNQVVNITEEVQRIVEKEMKRKEMKEGICLVYVPHATAALTINENWDPSVCDDFMAALAELIPKGKWRHDKVDGNGDAHVKAAIIGPSVTIPIKDGRLLLGTWQGIMLCEFDGPRERNVIVVCR
ncbi:MAG: secondary thiamine-phosphate synthase enzyme YjbQ [Candidatus Micrarchaeota archaeon]|nr:secondary thiamine-phosphate synthase enzyme YjbQ [Candidatus Micrarchaeota archaeon]